MCGQSVVRRFVSNKQGVHFSILSFSPKMLLTVDLETGRNTRTFWHVLALAFDSGKTTSKIAVLAAGVYFIYYVETCHLHSCTMYKCAKSVFVDIEKCNRS